MSQDIKSLIKSFVEDLIDLYGDEVLSVYLFGSSVSKEFVKSKSDINVLVIFSSLSALTLKRYLSLKKKWSGEPIRPVFIGLKELNTSLDVFPIEFLDMKQRNILLYGEDYIGEIEIDKASLRRQIEAELRTKLLALRQSFILLDESKRMREYLEKMVTGLLPLFKSLLYLLGEESPLRARELIGRVSLILKVDCTAFLDAWSMKMGEPTPYPEVYELFSRFHDALTEIVKAVDALEGRI